MTDSYTMLTIEMSSDWTYVVTYRPRESKQEFTYRIGSEDFETAMRYVRGLLNLPTPTVRDL